MVEIIDNFLPKSYYDSICYLITSEDFQWAYSSTTAYNSQHIFDKQFTHGILFGQNNFISPHSLYVLPICFMVEKIANTGQIVPMRIKFNLTMTVPEHISMPTVPHIDITDANPNDYYSGILYLGESDGGTTIYNETIEHPLSHEENENYIKNLNLTVKQEVDYKPNRLVLFDSKYIHRVNMPRHHKQRYILNMVLAKYHTS